MLPFLTISGSSSRACQSFSPSSSSPRASSQSNTSQDSQDAVLFAELDAYLSSLPKQPSQDTIQLSNRAKRPRLEESCNDGIYADSQLPTRSNTPQPTSLDLMSSSLFESFFDTPLFPGLPLEQPYSQIESKPSNKTSKIRKNHANLARKRGWVPRNADDKTASNIYDQNIKLKNANAARNKGRTAANFDSNKPASTYNKVMENLQRLQLVDEIKSILHRTLPASGQDFQGATPIDY